MSHPTDAWPHRDMDACFPGIPPLDGHRLADLHTAAIGLESVLNAIARHIDDHEPDEINQRYVHGLLSAARALARYSSGRHSEIHERLTQRACDKTDATGKPHQWRLELAALGGRS